MTIDVQACRLARQANNGGRRRRYSTDPARKRWYASSRSARFAARIDQPHS
jgi:hypothetical protein